MEGQSRGQGCVWLDSWCGGAGHGGVGLGVAREARGEPG